MMKDPLERSSSYPFGKIEDLSRLNFTVHHDSRINSLIAFQVAKISERILMEVKDVTSLFLLGGYGRGEGSVMLKPKGIVPLGDYDLLVVTNLPRTSPPHVSGIDNLQRQFHVQYHIGVDSVWKLRLPTVSKRIYWYEAKFGGKILSGDERVLGLVPIQSGKDIELSEGFSLIFNRLAGMLRVIDPIFCQRDLDEKEKGDLLFQSVKSILACGDSLLIWNGKYHFSYRRRCERFLNSFHTDSCELALIDPSLQIDYKEATNFKLQPTFDVYDNSLSLWFTAKEHVLHTTTYLLERTLSESIKQCKKRSDVTRPQDFPNLFLRGSKAELWDFLIFNWHALRQLKTLSGLLPKRSTFSDIARASLFTLALSIEKNGEVHREFLESTLSTLSKMIPVNKAVETEKDLSEKWRKTRNIALFAWSLCRS